MSSGSEQSIDRLSMNDSDKKMRYKVTTPFQLIILENILTNPQYSSEIQEVIVMQAIANTNLAAS